MTKKNDKNDLAKDQQRIVETYLVNQAVNDRVLAENFQHDRMDGCMGYIIEQARKLAQGGRAIMVQDSTVFGWAVHYFVEKLYIDNEKKKKEMALVKAHNDAIPNHVGKVKESESEQKTIKPEHGQLSMFDIAGFANA